MRPARVAGAERVSSPAVLLTASSGRKGLALLRTHAVNAVIADYEMPEMNGAELASQIRRFYPAIPILMVSGHGPHIPKLQLTAVDVVVDKNMFPEKLLLEISSLLDKGSSSQRRNKAAQQVSGTSITFTSPGFSASSPRGADSTFGYLLPLTISATNPSKPRFIAVMQPASES
jgi:CheY-like chemotaxis protein